VFVVVDTVVERRVQAPGRAGKALRHPGSRRKLLLRWVGQAARDRVAGGLPPRAFALELEKLCPPRGESQLEASRFSAERRLITSNDSPLFGLWNRRHRHSEDVTCFVTATTASPHLVAVPRAGSNCTGIAFGKTLTIPSAGTAGAGGPDSAQKRNRSR
jgi:hypothetical protein